MDFLGLCSQVNKMNFWVQPGPSPPKSLLKFCILHVGMKWFHGRFVKPVEVSKQKSNLSSLCPARRDFIWSNQIPPSFFLFSSDLRDPLLAFLLLLLLAVLLLFPSLLLLLLVGKYSLFRWRRRAKFRIPDARFSLSSSSSLFSFTSTQQRLLRPSSVCPHMHRQSASPPAADWTGQHTRIQDREEEKPHALTLNIRFWQRWSRWAGGGGGSSVGPVA